MAKLLVEPALPERTEEQQGTFLDKTIWSQPFVSNTNATQLDGLQYLRLAKDYSGEPSLERIYGYCKEAWESQSFYISTSRKQWLRTAILTHKSTHKLISCLPCLWPKAQTKPEGNRLITHSNVIPRQAYLNSPCRTDRQQCTRGFFRAADITDRSDNFCWIGCKDCVLANKLAQEPSKEDGNSETKLFWYLERSEVDVEGVLFEPNLSKILWRKGVFVMKLFKCEGSEQNPDLKRELEVALNVSHPNLVHYFGCSTWTTSGSENCLFMELLDLDLNRFVASEQARLKDDGSFSFQDSLHVLMQVAQAMKHLHKVNFLHGDLKPQNIFMSYFDSPHSDVLYYLVKVGDFGNAQRVHPSGASTVEPFNFKIGTTPYLAPEVVQCRKINKRIRNSSSTDFQRIEDLERDLEEELPKIDPLKIDVYSFGVTAYYVLTGVPFRYRNVPDRELLVRDFICVKDILDGDSLSLILSCLALEPNDRPSFSKICEDGLWEKN